MHGHFALRAANGGEVARHQVHAGDRATKDDRDERHQHRDGRPVRAKCQRLERHGRAAGRGFERPVRIVELRRRQEVARRMPQQVVDAAAVLARGCGVRSHDRAVRQHREHRLRTVVEDRAESFLACLERLRRPYDVGDVVDERHDLERAVGRDARAEPAAVQDAPVLGDVPVLGDARRGRPELHRPARLRDVTRVGEIDQSDVFERATAHLVERPAEDLRRARGPFHDTQLVIPADETERRVVGVRLQQAVRERELAVRPAVVSGPVSVALAVQRERDRVVVRQPMRHRAERFVAGEGAQVVREHVQLVERSRDERLEHDRRRRRNGAQPAPDERVRACPEQRRGRRVHRDEAQLTVESQERVVPPVGEALPEVHAGSACLTRTDTNAVLRRRLRGRSPIHGTPRTASSGRIG